MSGSRSLARGNVVPMPATSTPPPAPPPMPSPMWWGGAAPLPGCAPGGGGTGLIECYWGVQAATAFISAIMIDAINNNPDVTTAIIDAITASGSNLPLVGVTNGTDAQPGQVGEYVLLGPPAPGVAYPTTAANAIVTMGILQPGDWDVWSVAYFSQPVTYASTYLNPVPAGVVGSMGCALNGMPGENFALISPVARALISVPTLFVLELSTNTYSAGTAAGNASISLEARRRR